MSETGKIFGQAAGSGVPDRKKQFIKRIQELDRSKRLYEKFRDLCEMSYCAVAKTTATPSRVEELEARYMQIVGTYDDKDTVRAYPELLALTVQAVHEGYGDFLGSVASELELLDPYNGQFFTPYDVAKVMAQLTVNDVGPLIEEKGYITLHEPAAGSGVMVLACADIVQELGHNLTESMLVYAVDTSPLAYHMCYLQLAFRGVTAWVERGNSLTLKHFEAAWTPSAMQFHKKHGHLFDGPGTDSRSSGQSQEESTTAPERVRSNPEFSPSPPKEPPQQLGLF